MKLITHAIGTLLSIFFFTDVSFAALHDMESKTGVCALPKTITASALFFSIAWLYQKDSRAFFTMEQYRQTHNIPICLTDTMPMNVPIEKHLQQAWHIPDNAPACVHQALNGFIKEAEEHDTLNYPLLFLDYATKLTNDYSHPDHAILLETFYEKNGVFKDFSDYPSAAINLPEQMCSQEYYCTRASLNNVLYYMHTRSHEGNKNAAQLALDYLVAHFENLVDHPLEAQAYLLLHHAFTSALTSNYADFPLLCIPSNIIAHYQTEKQIKIHRAILAAISIIVDACNPEQALSMDDYEMVCKQMQQWLLIAIKAHKLNHNTKTDDAYHLLKKWAVTHESELFPVEEIAHSPLEDYQQYFRDHLHFHQEQIAHFFKETGIQIESIDLQHIFQPKISKRNSISGYHSTLFQNCIHELITSPDIDKCYEIKAEVAGKDGKCVINRKSMFPDNWTGRNIVDAFFNLLCHPEAMQITKKPGGYFIEAELEGQLYKFFAEPSGKITTFFPKTDMGFSLLA